MLLQRHSDGVAQDHSSAWARGGKLISIVFAPLLSSFDGCSCRDNLVTVEHRWVQATGLSEAGGAGGAGGVVFLSLVEVIKSSGAEIRRGSWSWSESAARPQTHSGFNESNLWAPRQHWCNITQVLTSQSQRTLYFYFTSAQRLYVVFHYIHLTALVTSYLSDYSSARSCSSRCVCVQLMTSWVQKYRHQSGDEYIWFHPIWVMPWITLLHVCQLKR